MIKLKELPKFFTLSRVESETDMVNEQQPPLRSEEHTSELQSRLHLVCRLLLEKKKKEKATELRVASLATHTGRRQRVLHYSEMCHDHRVLDDSRSITGPILAAASQDLVNSHMH